MNKTELLSVLLGPKTDRDRQTEIGPSQIGGCKRKVWMQLNDQPRVNETMKMAAWFGTAIHSAIEKHFEYADPFSERFLREVEVSHNGLKGHVDLYDVVENEVIDWKTTTKKNLGKFPSEQQWQQVQLYGWLLSNNGYPVETVTLVGMARDGNEDHIQIESQRYDVGEAMAGLQWLDEVRAMTEPPEPEKHKRFCANYCVFYDREGESGCPGM